MNKDLKIIRKNITASDYTEFEFDVQGLEFIVTNTNDFSIYAALSDEEPTSTDSMIKIPANTARVCLRNKSNSSDNAFTKVYIYSESAGEVEVQCIRF